MAGRGCRSRTTLGSVGVALPLMALSAALVSCAPAGPGGTDRESDPVAAEQTRPRPPDADLSPSSTEPAIVDGGSPIGSAYDDSCVIAWPSAPTYTSTAVVLTMTCSQMPSQYQFVQVVYPDPSFEIQPDQQVRVIGSVVDVAVSELGFEVLVVQADDVQG